MVSYRLLENRLSLQGPLTANELGRDVKALFKRLARLQAEHVSVDLGDVERIDSAGVAFLDEMRRFLNEHGTSVRLENVPSSVQEAIRTFSMPELSTAPARERASIFERLGEWVLEVAREFGNLLYLIADGFYFSVASLFRRHGVRKGEFVNQCILIGINALPIVALISFLIGFILALQSAAQLRQFGASIYVADLIAISMTREMGPIMTAIIFAGRSGSAIASEIATMVVTEETDALKAMALNPVRYVLVPKIYAITLMMPLLTILSMVIGILGSLVIGITYLDIGVEPFYNEVVNALILKDLLTGLVKSLVFAWIIVLVGAFYGFRVKGGAEGVGRATTASVVAAIFMVILADCLLGLIFYFGGGIEL